MTKTHFSLIFFVVLFSWIIPAIIQNYKIKDDIKHIETLPIGTAPFKAFLKLVKWVLLGWVLVSLLFLFITFTLKLFGVNF